MVRLRSMARKRGEQQKDGHASLQTNAVGANNEVGMAATIEHQTPSTATSPTATQQTLVQPTELQWGPNLVAAIGVGPPLGSQEIPTTPPRNPDIPSYTWERTNPINGKESGMFVLHLGGTP